MPWSNGIRVIPPFEHAGQDHRLRLEYSASEAEDEVRPSASRLAGTSGAMRRAPGRPHPVRAGGRRRPALATRDRMTAPSPAIRKLFVRDVGSVGRTTPTHFEAWAYIFGSVIVRALTLCLARDLCIRRFVPESRNPLVSSESDSAALAPLLASWTAAGHAPSSGGCHPDP